MLGCSCKVCVERKERNIRTRSSILITTKDKSQNLVIDTGPDFRYQAIRANINRLDAVLYTHIHADHCNGFDELRVYSFFDENHVIQALVDQSYLSLFRQRFQYAFEDLGYIGSVPKVNLTPLPPVGEQFSLLGLEIESIGLCHGNVNVRGFKIGRFAYVTDFKHFSNTQINAWKGKIDTMIASGVHFGSHPSHSVIEETVELFSKLEVRKGYLSHLSHEIDYHRDSNALPNGVEFSYDGLEFDI